LKTVILLGFCHILKRNPILKIYIHYLQDPAMYNEMCIFYFPSKVWRWDLDEWHWNRCH